MALTATRRRDVDHVIADVLQKGLATLDEIAFEARMAGRMTTPWLREAVADASRGMRSVGEADLRRVIVEAGLPEPEWNAPIETASGTFCVDAYWPEKRLGVEADGAAFHLSSDDWNRDLRRQNAIHGVGVRLLRFPVRRLRRERPECGAEIWRAFGAAME